MINLDLRAAADARARNKLLAARLVAALPKRPTLLLLRAASWPLLCWLAPRIARPQVWRLVDADRDAIDDAFERIADWAEERELTVTWPKRAMLVHLPGGAWRVEAATGFLSVPASLDLRGADAVLCEGLLPLMPTAWLDQFADACRRPLLATLNQTAPALVLPLAAGLPRDIAARAGAVAVTRLMTRLRRHGDAVWSAPTMWCARADEVALQQAWLAAEMREASDTAAVAQWAALRARQMMQGRLRIRVPGRDLLALPRGTAR